MPVAKLDPVDAFYSVGASLLGRIFLFFSAGWVGIFLARVAVQFREWQDFLNPGEAIGGVFSDFTTEVSVMTLWPIVALYLAGRDSAALFLCELVVLGVFFYLLVWTEEPTPFWWLILVGVISLIAVLTWEDHFNWVSTLALVVPLSGLGMLGWWALRAYHPELVEKADDVIQGRTGEDAPMRGAPPTPRRKAPPGTWPKGVPGFDDEDR